ncbi:hypothetical protein [Streptomyces sp. RKAG293]|uniref:hypothetical protein n=1 Tax=Streptomyces sp. RKAG293 TaxID=2893403 RepID=UPI002033F1BE|nr:hypothetical protein [Streptomyces sp. RKAG293]MCM2423154.1 hypothetical protein [Streptomyces sp. RKAG293]
MGAVFPCRRAQRRSGRDAALGVLLALLTLVLLLGGALSPELMADQGARSTTAVSEPLSTPGDEHPDEAATTVRAARAQRAAESSRAVRDATRGGIRPAPAVLPRRDPVPGDGRPGAGLLGLSCVVLRC